MSRERDFIARLATLATDPAARGLRDDCAVLPFGDRDLVLTHDMLVEGVHYLPGDPAGDVAWKLVAVNLSDLAAKGARPVGVLMGYMLGPDRAWDAAFVEGLAVALDRFAVPLLGGDTVSGFGDARALGLTAVGEVARGQAPSRAGARAGDGLWVTGTIGAAGLGLIAARAGRDDGAALRAYRRPEPRLDEGRRLASLVRAMADISDGLLIDATRMAAASGLAVTIDLDAVPIVPGYADGTDGRLAAAVAGDDYELLFAAPADITFPQDLAPMVTAIGSFAEGVGLRLSSGGAAIATPARLGYEHG